LLPTHFARVYECYPARNRLLAEGPIQPSSEALTHGTLYGLDTSIRAVVHAHSRLLWEQARVLALPITSDAATYGTPEMAEEVRRLFSDSDLPQRRIFAMGGHVAGVVAFGSSLSEASTILLQTLALALQRQG
jgi:ribulose-5-phosphate 4-epimerase/fuculose-1-phosphate aldolase